MVLGRMTDKLDPDTINLIWMTLNLLLLCAWRGNVWYITKRSITTLDTFSAQQSKNIKDMGAECQTIIDTVVKDTRSLLDIQTESHNAEVQLLHAVLIDSGIDIPSRLN